VWAVVYPPVRPGMYRDVELWVRAILDHELAQSRPIIAKPWSKIDSELEIDATYWFGKQRPACGRNRWTVRVKFIAQGLCFFINSLRWFAEIHFLVDGKVKRNWIYWSLACSTPVRSDTLLIVMKKHCRREMTVVVKVQTLWMHNMAAEVSLNENAATICLSFPQQNDITVATGTQRFAPCVLLHPCKRNGHRPMRWPYHHGCTDNSTIFRFTSRSRAFFARTEPPRNDLLLL
jgi:hypothetical protein